MPSGKCKHVSAATVFTRRTTPAGLVWDVKRVYFYIRLVSGFQSQTRSLVYCAMLRNFFFHVIILYVLLRETRMSPPRYTVIKLRKSKNRKIPRADRAKTERKIMEIRQRIKKKGFSLHPSQMITRSSRRHKRIRSIQHTIDTNIGMKGTKISDASDNMRWPCTHGLPTVRVIVRQYKGTGAYMFFYFILFLTQLDTQD